MVQNSLRTTARGTLINVAVSAFFVQIGWSICTIIPVSMSRTRTSPITRYAYVLSVLPNAGHACDFSTQFPRADERLGRLMERHIGMRRDIEQLPALLLTPRENRIDLVLDHLTVTSGQFPCRVRRMSRACHFKRRSSAPSKTR
jgi:hypothetical protein